MSVLSYLIVSKIMVYKFPQTPEFMVTYGILAVAGVIVLVSIAWCGGRVLFAYCKKLKGINGLLNEYNKIKYQKTHNHLISYIIVDRRR